MGGIFINDYVTDHVEMERIQNSVKKSLVSSAERYAETLYGLKNRILSENLYQNKESLRQLVADVNALTMIILQLGENIENLFLLEDLHWFANTNRN